MAENLGYEVKISQTGGKEILLGKEALKSVKFKIDTIEENVKDRSENVVNLVEITGSITDGTKEVTRELMLWALARKSNEVYRSAEIIIRINQNVRVRRYVLDKVFCVDYFEEFDQDDTNKNLFTLKFAQRKDNFEGIKVIC
ncbi:MAG: hypothetical protein K2N87_17340 [Eubacterium sp.]|nr:hypothetical protein [Eubacterium sp.]